MGIKLISFFLLMTGGDIFAQLPVKRFPADGHCSAPDSESGGKGGGTCSGGKGAEKEETGDQTHYDYLESETSEHWEKWLYAKETFTSDSDWSIRDLLDRADDHIVTEPEEALTQFRDILRSSPDSPRAQYAMLRARQFLNKTDFDDVTKAKDEEEIADGYLSLMRRPEEEVMGPIYFSALSQLLQLTSASNMTARKIEALEEALSGRASEGQNTHESLVQIYFLEGLLERAEVAVDVALGKFPTKFLFKFMKGLLLKKNDEKRKEGNRMLRAMDLEETNMHGIVSQVSELAAQLKARGRTEDMNLIYKEASKLHLYISVSQRPIEALPDLEAKPVWNTKDDVGLTAFDEEFTMLQDNWEIIKAEAIELRNNASNWQKVNQDDGAYEEFPLFTWGHRRAFHCSLAPKTCALVKRFRAAAKCNKGTTKFNVLRGGTRTASHAGPTNVRLRVQLGLQVPKSGKSYALIGGESLRWTEGEMVAFDDSFEHEYVNEDAEEERIVLSLDVPHPDLTYGSAKAAFTAEAQEAFMNY